uniref:Filamin-A n=1 Tax=Ascaris suum TaxID=6253 RepID=F1KQ16_ASCSU
MLWIKGKLPDDIDLKNFTSDWNSGIFLGALVDSCAPDLRIGWRSWDPANALQSTRIAMDVAEKHLSVVPLITAEELINPAVDEKSVMTYLAQFPQARYKPPIGFIESEGTDHAVVGERCELKLHTISESTLVDVLVNDPDGKFVDVVVAKEAPQLYSIQYFPRMEGRYAMTLKLREAAAGDSLELFVETMVVAAQYRFSYDEVAQVGETVMFNLENAGDGITEITVSDPNGREHVLAVNEDGTTRRAEFQPKTNGLHAVRVLWNGIPIVGSPFTFNVRSRAEPLKVWGRGIAKEGVRIFDVVHIYLKATGHSVTRPHVRVKGPEGDVPVKDYFDEDLKVWAFCYMPVVEGYYEIGIEYDEGDIERDTILVDVGGPCISRVRAFGPGVQSGVVMQPCTFCVQKTSPADEIDINVKDSDGNMIELTQCTGFEDGFMLVAYRPERVGIYEVSVTCDGEHISGSPFIVVVGEGVGTVKATNSRIFGIESHKRIVTNEEVAFTIDTANSSEGITPAVTILDGDFMEVPVSLKECQPGVFECAFSPKCIGRHYVLVSIANVAVPGTPFVVNVERECKQLCKLLQKAGIIYAGHEVDFLISAEESNPEVVEADLVDSDDSHIPVMISNNGECMYVANFIAPKTGDYKLRVLFDGEEAGVFDVSVEPPVDLSQIQLKGFRELSEEFETVFVGEHREFSIDTGGIQSCGRGLEVMQRDSHGSENPVVLIEQGDGVYIVDWEAVSEEEVTLCVLFDGIVVEETVVRIHRPPDASKCRAEGDGLHKAVVGETAKFTVDTADAGHGDVAIAIKGPNETKSTVMMRDDGSCMVEYIPSAPGLHSIDIRFGDIKQSIPGSPFMVMADYERDVSKIQLHGFEGVARRGFPVSFVIDASHTAAEKIEARLPAGFKQPVVEELESRIYLVTFAISDDVEESVLLDVLYGGQPITKSPLCFIITEPPLSDRIELKSAKGDRLPREMLASQLFSFVANFINPRTNEELVFEVNGPDRELRKVVTEPTSDGRKYIVHFTPDIIGVYILRVFINGDPVSALYYQLTCKPVGEADKCIIIDMPKEDCWGEGESKRFAIDVGGAGSGAVSVLSSPEGEVKTDIQKVEDCLYYVTLTPLTVGMHRVVLLYGGREIPGGVVWFECLPLSELEKQRGSEILERSLELDELKSEVMESCASPVGKSRCFEFHVGSPSRVEELKAKVITPSGKCHSTPIKNVGDGKVLVEYVPVEKGRHVLSIQEANIEIPGSPVDFYVGDEDEAIVIEGMGIEKAIAGQPAEFVITTKAARAQKLAVLIEGVARAKIVTREEGKGKCTVTWIAPIPGEYLIHIKLAGEHISGSPFKVVATGAGYKRSHVSVESASEVTLGVSTSETSKLSATMESPHGEREPCPIRIIDNHHIGVQFTPRGAGTYEITVVDNGVAVKGSPFPIAIGYDEVGDASKVIVSGAGKADAICQLDNELIVNTRRAGAGKIFVCVHGPSNANVKCNGVDDSIFRFSYRPTEPGLYTIVVKFNGQHTKGSPFTVECIGEGIGNVEEVVSTQIARVPVVMAGHETHVALHLPNADAAEVEARVIQPNGSSQQANIYHIDEKLYLIEFKPEVKGVHVVSVFHRGEHIAGSPFQFTVGRFGEGGAYKARIGGIDLTAGEVNEVLSFNVYTREAGEGTLEVSVEGPSKADVRIIEHEDGNLHVEYKVSSPGEYIMGVKFNGEHLPDSPFKVLIGGVLPSRGKAIVSVPEGRIKPGEACTLNLTMPNIPGDLEAQVRSPNNNIIRAALVPVDNHGCYQLIFTPREVGVYLLELTVDGVRMRESPLRIRVGSSSDRGDASLVTVGKEEMGVVQTGRQSQFTLDTRRAGAGLLYIQFDGPSKVALDAYRVESGEYLVRFTAFAAGVYYVTVKYSDVHVPGSPFKVIVEGPTLAGSGERESSIVKVDTVSHYFSSCTTKTELLELKGEASEVTVDGNGIKKFIPGQTASFFINTASAGIDVLLVGVLTTTGRCDEVHVTYIGDGRYRVNYLIMENCNAFVYIRYGSSDVPGSPFAVSC